MKKRLFVVVIIHVIVVSFVAGFFVRDAAEDAGFAANGDATVETARKLILKYSVHEDLTEEKLRDASIEGMVRSLGDKHSFYADPTTYARYKSRTAHQFAGIGTSIAPTEEKLPRIERIMPGSPAEGSDLRNGDVIIAVDGAGTEGQDLESVVDTIRGERGTPVTITVQREGVTEPIEITIVRDLITIDAVILKMHEVQGKRFAYLRITDFDRLTEEQFASVVKTITDPPVNGIILDLRGNPGGFVDVAKSVGCHWVSGGLLMSSEGRGGVVNERIECPQGAALNGMPTIVLVDKGSASASEILAGALQDHKLGFLMGQKTYGKGSGQNAIDMANGGHLRITSFLWFTPNHRSIDGVGLQPDELLPDLPKGVRIGDDADPHVEHALQHLKSGH